MSEIIFTKKISFPKKVNYAVAGINPARRQNIGKDNQQSLFQQSNGIISTKNKAFLAFGQKVEKQNNSVILHENAHLSGSGPQASGMPVYNTRNIHGYNVIVGGHQNVLVPAMISFMATKPQIEKTMKAARYTINGAEAPSSLGGQAGILSAADKNVAAQGRAILSAAETAFGKRSEFDEKLQQKDIQKTDTRLTPKLIAKTKGGKPKKHGVGQRIDFTV